MRESYSISPNQKLLISPTEKISLPAMEERQNDYLLKLNQHLTENTQFCLNPSILKNLKTPQPQKPSKRISMFWFDFLLLKWFIFAIVLIYIIIIFREYSPHKP